MSPSNRTKTAATRRLQIARAVLAAAVLIGGLAAGCGSGSGGEDVGDRAAIQAKMNRLARLGVPGITAAACSS
jgi:hypothetical protein